MALSWGKELPDHSKIILPYQPNVAILSDSCRAYTHFQQLRPFSAMVHKRFRPRARALRRPHRAAADSSWAPPPPTLDGRRASAADILSARRRCHVGVLNYFGAFFVLWMNWLFVVASCEIEEDIYFEQFLLMWNFQNSSWRKPSYSSWNNIIKL